MINKNITILAFMVLIIFSGSHYLFADNSQGGVFKTKRFSIYVDPKGWQLVEGKKEDIADDPVYIKTDIENALSDPIIGKGSERILIVSEDSLEFKNKEKQICFFVIFFPVALWQMEDKTIEQLATAFRDAYLLNSDSEFVNIKNCDIRYSKKEINGSPFFYVSYVYDGVTSYGSKNYTTSSVYNYISSNLRNRYCLNMYNYDSRKPLEEPQLRDILERLTAGFEPIEADADSEYLEYIIYSANSLYIALRRQSFFNEEDKQPMSIYKTPISIEEDGFVKRKILSADLMDIRQHPIQKKIEGTIKLLKESLEKYTNEPKIYYGLGLLYEFNSFGERYGDGFDKNLAISAYQKALSIDPTFLPARHNLAIIYLRDGDLDKGIHALEQMLDNKKIEIDTCCVLAYAYEKKHDFLSAINYYKLALNGFTANIKKAAPELFKHINEKIKQLKRQ